MLNFVRSIICIGMSMNQTAITSNSTGAAKRIEELANQSLRQLQKPSNVLFEIGRAAKQGSDQVKHIPWECLQPLALTKREAMIGSGAFSMVLKAKLQTSTIGSVDVAIKIFSQDFGSLDDYDKLYSDAMHEAGNMLGIRAQMLSDDGIVKVFGVASGVLTADWSAVLDQRDGKSCAAIVMKYESAGSLANLLYPKRFIELKTKLNVLKSLAEVLSLMHGVGGIHGDLKPQNILLSSRTDPIARLADFGLSDIRPIEYETKTKTKTSITTASGGVTRGTYPYCAPEMLPNPDDPNSKISKASPASDIYAFGILAWEVLAHSEPFAEVRNDVTLCAKVWRDERPSLAPAVVGMNLPQSVTDLIGNCWQRDKSLRPNAKDCFEVLKEACEIVSSNSKDIFFSYCWENKYVLTHVLNFLTSLGYSVWFDENDMKLKLDDSMKEGIANSKFFLACVSRSYENSVNCQFELNHIHSHYPEKPIIALMLEKFDRYDPNTIAVAVAVAVTASSPADSASSRWKMGKVMDGILQPRTKLYCSISDIVERWPAEETVAGQKQRPSPSNEMLQELNFVLQQLSKILETNGCHPSFTVASKPQAAATTTVTVTVTGTMGTTSKTASASGGGSVALAAGSRSPKPPNNEQPSAKSPRTSQNLKN